MSGLAEPPRADIDPVLLGQLRLRLERALLGELQTGGGMSLEMLCPDGARSEAAAARVAEIHALVARLRDLRADMADRLARDIVAQLRPRALIDIGAGLAPWSIAIAKRAPALDLTALDLPSQVPALTRTLSEASLPNGFAVVAADALTFDFYSVAPQDVAIVANVCHVMDGARTRRLLGQAMRALRRDGLLVVIDQVLDDAPDWRRWAALYAVGAPHWLPGGHLFTRAEYRAWLEAAGGYDIRHQPISAAPDMTMISARAVRR